MALFTFSASDSFPLPSSSQDPILVTFDATNGTMVVQVPEEEAVPFPLIDNEAEPLPRAIYVDISTTPGSFQVGSVTYGREGLLLQHIELNDVQIGFSVASGDGHLGILDIRDVGRQSGVIHYFELMPVVLSIEGNYLVAKTLQYDEEDVEEPWYVIY